MEGGTARPRVAVRVIGWALIVALPLLALELAAATYYTIVSGRFISVHERLSQTPNAFVNIFNRPADCRYVDSLHPHPYLAFAHKFEPDKPCQVWSNHLGLVGREYPSERDPRQFSILLAGGSVASQVAQIFKDGPLFLEEALNRCFKPPRGERFVVLNGGDGGWKQPTQAILFQLYGEAFDAVVTLDGFNEHYFLESKRLEIPAPNFIDMSPLVTGSYDTLGATWLANEMLRFARGNPILSRSFLVYAAVDLVKARLERIAAAGASSRTFDGMFSLPDDWPAERKFAFNMEQYRKYIRSIDVLAKSWGLRTAYFIQPVPAIGKPLSEEEKKVMQGLEYGAIYQRLADNLLGLSKEGIPIFSLLHVFADRTETLYGDAIHMKYEGHDSPGYRIMADAIARRLAEAWSLEPRGLDRTCPGG